MIEAIARRLFNVWRVDQTGDTWDQLSESEQDAWKRVATEILGKSIRRLASGD
jgi:hypothetical protein